MPVINSKFSQFIDGSSLEIGDIVVGLRGGLNTKFVYNGASGGGGITNWKTITAASVSVLPGDGIVSNRSITPVQVELPIGFDVGDEVAIMGLGAGGWTLIAGAGTSIEFGSVTTSIAGSISSDITNANIFVRGLVANTTWTVVTVNSNPTYL